MYGELSFAGNATSYLLIPTSSNINFGTEDFTIEWYQYQTDENPFPRIFQIGSYGNENISIGVSIEGGQLYYWVDTSAYAVASLTTYKNIWVAFAICRTAGFTQLYMNGESIGTPIPDTYDYTSSESLVISNETVLSDSAAFGGYMHYFHWVKGLAKYTSNYSVNSSIPPILEQTSLLLTASSFLGDVQNYNVGIYIPYVPTPIRMPMFSDNSIVYYKPHSLPAGGINTVRNHRTKSKRT
jgi:hypothetical protein